MTALLWFFYIIINLGAQELLATSIEKPIVVAIASRNNIEWYEKNLNSLLSQNYTNWIACYCDDASDDGMSEAVQNYLQQHDTHQQIMYTRSAERMGNLWHHWQTIHACPDAAIIVILDGDDWLAHENVLQIINTAYQEKDIWLTYGQYETHPTQHQSNVKRYPRTFIEQQKYRQGPFQAVHLRTFYAWLFKQIPLEDLMYSNKLFPMAVDVATMTPMLEMAGHRIECMQEPLYIYNNEIKNNHHNINKQLQLFLSRITRSKAPYPVLEQPIIIDQNRQPVDLFIISEQSPEQLATLLESMPSSITGLGTAYVMYCSSNEQQSRLYSALESTYSHVLFFQYSNDLSTVLYPLLKASPSSYCMLAHDALSITHSFDLYACTQALAQTHAYGFYLCLGRDITRTYPLTYDQPVSNLIPIGPDIFAWKFKNEEGRWAYPNNLDMTIYTKKTLLLLLENSYATMKELYALINNDPVEFNQVGLCFEHSKIQQPL